MTWLYMETMVKEKNDLTIHGNYGKRMTWLYMETMVKEWLYIKTMVKVWLYKAIGVGSISSNLRVY